LASVLLTFIADSSTPGRYNRKLWIRDSLRNVVYLPGK
jgi:hypothetical protein